MINKNKFAIQVGKKIKKARNELGLRQCDVVKEGKISKAMLSEVENGKRQIGFRLMCELAKTLKKPVGYFSDKK